MSTDLQQLMRDAERQGFEFDRTANGHYQARRDGEVVSVLSGTPSDTRSIRNSVADLKRAGYRPTARKARPRDHIHAHSKYLAAIVDHLRANGGEVRDASGMVTARIAAAIGATSGAVSGPIARLEAKGLVARETRGRRTYAVLLLEDVPATPAPDPAPETPTPAPGVSAATLANALLLRVGELIHRESVEDELRAQNTTLRETATSHEADRRRDAARIAELEREVDTVRRQAFKDTARLEDRVRQLERKLDKAVDRAKLAEAQLRRDENTDPRLAAVVQTITQRLTDDPSLLGRAAAQLLDDTTRLAKGIRVVGGALP